MQFLNPFILWTLAFLAVPIIIHLFHFRRFKKVYFSNVKFLKELKEETSSRSRLKNLLILISRLLALAAIILAFAQPFLVDDDRIVQGKRTSSIFIDNSFSMEAKSEDVILLEKAKARALEIVASHAEDDLIQILTHDFEGRHQRLVSPEEALGFIEDIEIGPSVKKMSSIVNRQKQCLQKETAASSSIYILSDFQKGIMDEIDNRDTALNIYLMPFQSIEESNVSIDSAWFDSPVVRPNEVNRVIVKMTNRGNITAENIRLAILHEGQEKPISVSNIGGGETRYDTFNLSVSKKGWQGAQLFVADHPITFDDHYYIAFNVEDEIGVIVLQEGTPNRYLKSALKGIVNASVTFNDVRNVDYSTLSKYNLIIVDDLGNLSSGLSSELIKYLQNGGNVALFPSKDINRQEYNDFLSKAKASNLAEWTENEAEVGSLNTDEFIFKNVFTRISRNVQLPKTKGQFRMQKNMRSGEEVILRYRSGDSYMSKFNVERGRLYLFSSPLNTTYNSLVKEAEIFVPLTYKMAISKSIGEPISYIIGEDEFVELSSAELENESVVEVKGDKPFIPGIRRLGNRIILSFEDQIQKDGHYSIYNNENLIQMVGFNYSRLESNLGYSTSEELKSFFGPASEVIDLGQNDDLAVYLKEKERGKPLWRHLLILSLIFLAIEQILIRFWRT